MPAAPSLADRDPTVAPATPLVAIVGRPNVGKSTLFNRLTGKRTALVSDMPGLTRDRRTERATVGGHKIELVDTAGLEEAPPGSIPARMRAQSEAAIRAADLILFVIDARDGITPADKQFAEVVRKSGRPAILVANKCEGRKGLDGAYESFSLGLGDPVAVSAEHGEGLADLTIDLLAALGALRERPNGTRVGADLVVRDDDAEFHRRRFADRWVFTTIPSCHPRHRHPHRRRHRHPNPMTRVQSSPTRTCGCGGA